MSWRMHVQSPLLLPAWQLASRPGAKSTNLASAQVAGMGDTIVLDGLDEGHALDYIKKDIWRADTPDQWCGGAVNWDLRRKAVFTSTAHAPRLWAHGASQTFWG